MDGQVRGRTDGQTDRGKRTDIPTDRERERGKEGEMWALVGVTKGLQEKCRINKAEC